MCQERRRFCRVISVTSKVITSSSNARRWSSTARGSKWWLFQYQPLLSLAEPKDTPMASHAACRILGLDRLVN